MADRLAEFQERWNALILRRAGTTCPPPAGGPGRRGLPNIVQEWEAARAGHAGLKRPGRWR